MAKTPHPNPSPINPNPSVVVALTEIIDLSISNISEIALLDENL